MNTNTNKNNDYRFVCDNWDKPEVVLASKGKGRAPARKVVTNDTVRIVADELVKSIATNLRSGKDVRLVSKDHGDFVRFIPFMHPKLNKMIVRAEAMGSFRDVTLADKHAKFIRLGKEVSSNAAKAYMNNKRDEAKAEEVTPDTMVTCPKCKYTFRVGRRVAA